jgi:hypothetical protein
MRFYVLKIYPYYIIISIHGKVLGSKYRFLGNGAFCFYHGGTQDGFLGTEIRVSERKEI